MSKSQKTNEIIIYLVILAGTLLVMIILSQHALSNYHSFRGYQSYFKNNPSPQIEDWMTPYTIIRHFNISQADLFQELNISISRSSLATPLKQICQKEKIDCAKLIERLNNLRR